MKRKYKKGFFLVETLVVIGILGIVVTLLFKSFYNLYSKFSASEYYNTVTATNAAYNIHKYLDNQGVSYNSVIGSNNFFELTNYYDNEFFTTLKSQSSIKKIYLIKPDKISVSISNFDVLFRKYLLTLENEETLLLVVTTVDGEYGLVRIK